MRNPLRTTTSLRLHTTVSLAATPSRNASSLSAGQLPRLRSDSCYCRLRPSTRRHLAIQDTFWTETQTLRLTVAIAVKHTVVTVDLSAGVSVQHVYCMARFLNPARVDGRRVVPMTLLRAAVGPGRRRAPEKLSRK